MCLMVIQQCVRRNCVGYALCMETLAALFLYT
jgi:hypothetical protein